jgi:hypothetical protein
MVPDYSYSRPSRIFETRPWCTKPRARGGIPRTYDGDNPFCFVLESEKSNKNEYVVIYGIKSSVADAAITIDCIQRRVQ